MVRMGYVSRRVLGGTLRDCRISFMLADIEELYDAVNFGPIYASFPVDGFESKSAIAIRSQSAFAGREDGAFPSSVTLQTFHFLIRTFNLFAG